MGTEVLKKLEEVLTEVKMINLRIDKMETKLDDVNKTLDTIELKFSNQINELEVKNNEKITELTNQVAALQKFKEHSEKTSIMQDSYNKRQNFLIHGLEETSAWETRSELLNICETFLSEALDLDPANLSNVDVHKLLQWPVFKDSEKVYIPIIVKLSNALTNFIYLANSKN